MKNTITASILASLLFTASTASALGTRPVPPGRGGGGLVDPGTAPPRTACAEPPAAPFYVWAGAQGATTLGLSFSDSGDCETSYQLQHRNADVGGQWVTRGTLPALAGIGGTFTDVGLLEDTYYCYRVLAQNDYGASASTTQLCMKTRQLAANSRALHDVRLRIKTDSASNAGTDSPVQVRLNAKATSGWYPIRNETWLNYGRDDFQTNDEWTYILNNTNLPHDDNESAILSDISLITVDVQGSDALCISELELLVNGAPAYRATYAPARCASEGSSLTVTKAELRASSLWQGFTRTSPPLDLSEEGVGAGIEAQIGHRLHGTSVYWDGSPAPNRVDGLWLGFQAHPNTYEGFVLNVPLGVDVNNFLDPRVLIQVMMELESTCTDNRTTVRVYSSAIYADVGFDWWTEAVFALASAGLYFWVEPALDDYAEGETEPMEMEFTVPADGCYEVSYQEGLGFLIGVP